MITLLVMANHREKEWEWQGEKFKTEPGQFVTSLEKIAQKCGRGITIQNIRTALKRFERYGFLTNKSTNRNRLVSIVNWEIYQSLDEEDNKPSGRQLTSNQQATNKQLTTNKNVKNLRTKEVKDIRRKRVYDETSNFYQLAVFFFEQIKSNNPDHKLPNYQVWADDVRKMVELDKRTEDQIKYLMQWVQQDDFEMANVLSPAKLRKRFDNLVMKVKQQKKQQPLPDNVTPIKKKYNYGF
ncbi:hypothetical protein RWE15_24035 [Virgibacillus halophilus]|uniref:Uncharacterized protein n=1 Tax=Tigheibacillus halophilus TaxID=361280 RepID=A0ABU5CBV9_9BACI|nr:hypothetical protein [Virgibacillus halophilus]